VLWLAWFLQRAQQSGAILPLFYNEIHKELIMNIQRHVQALVVVGSFATQGLSARPVSNQVEPYVAAKVHYLNQSEIVLAQEATERSASDGVKDFAATLIKEHGDADAKLLTLAEQLRFAVGEYKPRTPKDQVSKVKHELAVARLRAMTGKDFDRAYLRLMIKEHTKTIAWLTAVDAKVQTPEFKAFIAELIPVLENHLQQAKDLAASLD